jgi:CheY-like chemotaxis protein
MPSLDFPELTILVVEDEWLVREVAVAFLRVANCEVIEAADGEAAVKILAERRDIDLVFTDIRLGGKLSGWDVGEASRALDPDIQVVYTSGTPSTPERRVSGSAFLAKPYEPETVIRACRELCSTPS